MAVEPVGSVSAVTTPDPKLAKAAQGFEQMLVRQLAEILVASTHSEDETDDAASSLYQDMLPDALAESVANGGGIGLAPALTQSLGTVSEAGR